MSSTPSNTVVAGSSLRLSVAGFADGATLRVSVTDQPDFVVNAANGSYIWETYVPLSAPSKTFTIHAADSSGVSADGSYTVKSSDGIEAATRQDAGRRADGSPGAQLAQKLKVQLQDENGTPVMGMPVTFAASPGAQLFRRPLSRIRRVRRRPSSAFPWRKDWRWSRQKRPVWFRRSALAPWRLPPDLIRPFLQSDAAFGGMALGKGTGDHRSKRRAANLGGRDFALLPEPWDLTGAADPGSLNQFLQNLCHAGADGAQVCDGFLTNPDSAEQVVNLWRVGGLVDDGLDVSVESTDVGTARDLVSQGLRRCWRWRSR